MKTIKQIWTEEYIGKDGKCYFCQNRGYVIELSDKRFCICPNGRKMKAQEDRIKRKKLQANSPL